MRKPVLCHMWTTKAQISLPYSRSLISTFVVRSLGNIIPVLATSEITKTLACFCSWAGQFESYLIPKTGLFVTRLICIIIIRKSALGRTRVLDSNLIAAVIWAMSVLAICKQQRRRSACASAQSDQRLCCSLHFEEICCSLCYLTSHDRRLWANHCQDLCLVVIHFVKCFITGESLKTSSRVKLDWIIPLDCKVKLNFLII